MTQNSTLPPITSSGAGGIAESRSDLEGNDAVYRIIRHRRYRLVIQNPPFRNKKRDYNANGGRAFRFLPPQDLLPAAGACGAGTSCSSDSTAGPSSSAQTRSVAETGREDPW